MSCGICPPTPSPSSCNSASNRFFPPPQKQIIVDPLSFSEERFRPSLEERLESIISGAALMADSSCTRDDRRERIVAECNSVRQALQDLLSEYMGNVSVSPVSAFCCCRTCLGKLHSSRHSSELIKWAFENVEGDHIHVHIHVQPSHLVL